MWLWMSLAAGTLQTARNGLSRRLGTHVDPAVNSWARFAFNLPWALLALAIVSLRYPLPRLGGGFWFACGVGAVSQLMANVALVSAFRHGTFAGSIVLHKLEVVLTAVAGAWLFSEWPSAVGWGGIGLCVLGTAAINLSAVSGRGPLGGLRRALHLDRSALLALACAALLVVASFAVKRALVALAADNPDLVGVPLLLPLHALLHVTWIEVALLSVALLARDPGALRRVPEHAGLMAAVGASAFASSLCWYAAFADGLVAYVRAIGQVEALLSVFLGLFVFRERETLRQLPGAALILVGMLAVLLG